MNTGTMTTTGRLIVDWDHGLITRADDLVEITEKLVELHPFIVPVQRNEIGDVDFIVGPRAKLAAAIYRRGLPIDWLNVVVYGQVASVAGLLTLQKETP